MSLVLLLLTAAPSLGAEQALTPSVPKTGAGTSPSVAWSPTGEGFVVWVDRRRGSELDLFGTGISIAGVHPSRTDVAVAALPGDQDHPALGWSALTSSFTVVYEQSLDDGGVELGEIDLGVAPTAGVGFGSPQSLGPGRSPSVAATDGGLLLAYAPDPYTLRLARLKTTGLVLISETAVDAGIVQTATSVLHSTFVVGVELYDEASHEQHARAYALEGSELKLIHTTSPVVLAGPDRGTSVLVGPNADDRAMVTRASATSYTGWRKSSTIEGPISSPALLTAAAATLLSGPTGAQVAVLRTIRDELTIVSTTSGSATTTIPLDSSLVGRTHNHLVASDRFVVWETGTPAHVVGAPVVGTSSGATWPVVIPRSPPPQTAPHVSLTGNSGWVVWRSGDDVLQSLNFVTKPDGELLVGNTTAVVATDGAVVLGRHGLASGDATALVTWRESSASGATLKGQFVPTGQSVTLWQVDAGVALDSDVGPVVRRAGSQFFVLNSFGDQFRLFRLDEQGMVLGADPLQMLPGDTDAELDCPGAGGCFVGFRRPGAGVYSTAPSDPTATLISSEGDRVLLTHDTLPSQTLYAAWRTPSGYLAGIYEPNALVPQNAVRLPIGAEADLVVAPGHDPIGVVTRNNSMSLTQFRSWTVPLGFGAQAHVATADGLAEPTGAVVYTRVENAREGRQLFGRSFSFMTDGGDAGSSEDAGAPEDAGTSDGGVGATDGGSQADAGPQTLYFSTQPCGCGSGAEGLFALGALLWWGRRTRR